MFTDDIKFLQKAVVFHPTEKEKFLALKRPADAFSRPNDWDLPGGNVLFGELHEESLRKEIREESSLEVGDLRVAQMVTNYDAEKEIYFIFVGQFTVAKGGEVKISAEHSEFRWVTRQEFKDLKPAQFLVDLAGIAFEDKK